MTKRTLAYRRLRRTKRRSANAGARGVRHDDVVLFDPRFELPTATLRPTNHRLALIGGLQRWLLARWRWFVPRAIPVAVAAVSLVLVMICADGLLHFSFNGR